MFCTNCGARLADGAGACAACGNAVGEPVAAEPDGTSEPGNSPMRRRTVGMVAGGLIVLVLMLGILLAVNRSPRPSEREPDVGPALASEAVLSGGELVRLPTGPSGQPTERWTERTAAYAFTDAGGALLAMTTDRIARLDPSSGEEIWVFDPPGDQFLMPSTVQADEVFLVNVGERLVALGLDDGNERWSVDVGDLTGFMPSLADGAVILSTGRPGLVEDATQQRFEVLDLDDGEVRWIGKGMPFLVGHRVLTAFDGRVRLQTIDDGATIESFPIARTARLVTGGGDIAVLSDGRRSWAMSLDTGEELFGLPYPLDDPYDDECSIMDGLLGCSVGVRTLVYDLGNSGEELVSTINRAGGGQLVRVDGELLDLAGDGAEGYLLLDPRTGEERLRLRPGGQLQLTSCYVLDFRSGVIHAYDPHSGEEVWSVPARGDDMTAVNGAVVITDQQSESGEVTARYLA